MENFLSGFDNLNFDKGQAPAYVPQDFNTRTQNAEVKSFSESFKSSLNDAFKDLDKPKDLTGSGITFADRSQTDIYRFQKDFNPVGFNPSDSLNYEKFLSRETFGSALSKGLDSFAHKFGGTFKDYWKDYGRMANALVSWDWGKMMPDEDEMMKQYYLDQIDMNKNFVFVDPADEDGIFNKRFLSEFIGNAGFAMGTFSALSMEIAADILLTGLTGGAGAGSLGATFARLSGKAAAKAAAREGAEKAVTSGFFVDDLLKGFASTSGKSIDQIATAANAAKVESAAKAISGRTASATEELVGTQFGIFSRVFDISKSKSAAEIAANMGRALPVVGSGVSMAEKMAAGAKAGLSIGELTGMGIQGVRRMAQELNMASTEASFEAISSYGDALTTLIDDHRNRYGEAPNAEQVEKMKSLALSASSGNYNTNMAILLATNKLQFGNLFNKYAPANRIMRELTETTDNNLLTVANKKLVQVYDKGKFGTVSVLGRVAKDFGKKEAAYQMGKSFMKNVAKFEISEGIQENLQEMSGSAWKNFYLSKYDSTGFTLAEAFEMGLDEQFTKQGFKTFLMGALTGSIISGPTKAINISLDSLREGVQNFSETETDGKRPSVLAKEQYAKDIETLNTRLREVTSANFENKVFNFNVQMNSAMDMADAAAQGKEYEFQNAKDDAFLGAVSVAKRTGSIKALQQAMRNMGENMTEDEFKAAFNIDLKETKYKSPREFAESIATKIEEYSDTVDSVKKSVGPYVDPMVYEARSIDRVAAIMLRNVQEDLVEVIALNKIRGGMAAERARQVAEKFQSIKSLADSSGFAVRVMADVEMVYAEMGTLEQEIFSASEQLKEVLDPMVKQDLKDQIKAKTEKVKALESWFNLFEKKNVTKIEEKEDGTEESAVFTEFGGFLGVKKTVKSVDAEGKEVSEDTFDQKDEKVIKAFKAILDIHNKENGSKPIPDGDLQQAFDLFMDYINLDKHTKDYMNAVEVFTDPQKIMGIFGRMYSGKVKHQIMGYLSEVGSIANKSMITTMIDSDKAGKSFEEAQQDALNVSNYIITEGQALSSYKKLEAMMNATDMEHDISDWDYIQKQLVELKEELKKIVENSLSQVSVKEEAPVVVAEVAPAEVAPEVINENPVVTSENNDPAVEEQPEFADPEAVNLPEATEQVPETQNPAQESGVKEPEIQDDSSAQLRSVFGIPPTFSAEPADDGNSVVQDEKSSSIGKSTTFEEADAKAQLLNTALENTEFSKKFLGEEFSSDEKMVNAFVEAATKAQKAYESRTKRKTPYPNLEAFSKVAAGKKALGKVKATLLGLDQQKPVRMMDGTGKLPQDTSFELSSPASKMVISLDDLKHLHSEVLQIVEKDRQALQNPDKSGKFVEKGPSEKEQLERQAIELLDMITKCTR
jgi:hypothetical protein